MVSDEVWRPLAGASVRVLDGPMHGVQVTSDGAGQFQLSGTGSGRVTLQVAADGFKPTTYTAQWRAPINRSIEVIRLESLNRPAWTLDPGDYTATISMDLSTAHDLGPLPPCAGFPADMASRTYNATITATPDAPIDRMLSLQAPTVFSNSQVRLSIAERVIGFEMEYPFTEEFPGFRYLNIMGTAPTEDPVTVSDTAVSIPFSALFQYCELNSQTRLGWENCQHAPAVRFHACSSNSARMVLTKRR
jgi:hypothetical protein